MRKLETRGYAVMVFGAIADQVSTRIGLTHPDIYETNPVSRYLMGIGMWLPFDIIVISLMIGVLFVILRKWNWKYTHKCAILAYPYTYGIVRLMAGIWNISLFCSMIGV